MCAWSVLDPGTPYALRSFFQYDLEWSSGLTWHVADMHSKWNIFSEHVTQNLVCCWQLHVPSCNDRKLLLCAALCTADELQACAQLPVPARPPSRSLCTICAELFKLPLHSCVVTRAQQSRNMHRFLAAASCLCG